jgi:SNF2 family DNA or RNA helicase
VIEYIGLAQFPYPNSNPNLFLNFFNLGVKKEQVAVPKKEKARKSKEVYRGLGKKILVFAHHHCVLDALETFLREKEVGHVRIDGTYSHAHKHVLVTQFQEDDETDVALLSIKACGTGLNLTRANVALFAGNLSNTILSSNPNPNPNPLCR